MIVIYLVLATASSIAAVGAAAIGDGTLMVLSLLMLSAAVLVIAWRHT